MEEEAQEAEIDPEEVNKLERGEAEMEETWKSMTTSSPLSEQDDNQQNYNKKK